MSIRIIASAISAVSFLIASSAAQAATVQPVSGQVMINQGQGYQTIKNPIKVKPGDRVIVNPGGFAKVNYSDGCNIPIQPGAVATIGAKSPCTISRTEGSMTQTQTVNGQSQVVNGEAPVTPTICATPTDLAICVGVVAAVTGGIIAASNSGGSKKRAASP